MKSLKNIKQSIQKLTVNSSDEIHSRVLDKLLRVLDNTNKQLAAKQPNIWRTIMINKITRFAAAAVIIVAVLLSITFLDKTVTPAYGITDAKELFQTSNTIHMKGRMYFPLTGLKKEQSSVEVEYWLDTENGRWNLTYPGYSVSPEAVEIYVSDHISDGIHEMRLNHKDKTVIYKNLSSFQRRLFARKNIYTFLELICLNDLFDYIKVGQEVINGADFDIWKGLREGNLGTQIKLKAWLSPTTGNFGRIETWVQQADGTMAKLMEIDLVERNIDIPEEIFLTDAPADYVLKNTKDTAPWAEMETTTSGSVNDLMLNIHIAFTLADGSVVVCWESTDKEQDSQDDLFSGLEFGGALPKLPIEIDSLKSIGGDTEYFGYHLAYTKKDDRYFEWSIYVPQNETQIRKDIMGYQAIHRYNSNEEKIASSIALEISQDIQINTEADFSTWVLGAFEELNDDRQVPDNINYKSVQDLSNILRESTR